MCHLHSISKSRARAATLAVVLLLGIAPGWAQATRPQDASGKDPFSSIDASLQSAADRALTTSRQSSVGMPPSDTFFPAATAEAVTAQAKAPQGAIHRVQQLRPILEPILRAEGVPTELAAVVLVESGGQANALSPKGARGLWQFMPDTARRFGLVVTSQRDERLDIQRSTRAAARYLRDLYGQFEDWQLAFAAYNAGGNLVQQAINRDGTRDFSKLSSGQWIPLETRKYVPAVVAATKMFSNPNGAMAAPGPIRPVWKVYAEARQGNENAMK